MSKIDAPTPAEVEHYGGSYTKLIEAMKAENAKLRTELEAAQKLMSELYTRLANAYAECKCAEKDVEMSILQQNVMIGLGRIEQKDAEIAALRDPFKLKKEIRKGIHDKEIPDYEIITGWIQRCPMTWVPGLLIDVVYRATVSGVFNKGGLLKVAEQTIDKIESGTWGLR